MSTRPAKRRAVGRLAQPPAAKAMPPAPPAEPSSVLHVLDSALDKSHAVKAEVQACAEDLGSANEAARERIEHGETMLPADQALRSGLDVESRVQGCADDLQQVTDNLAHGVQEVKQVEQALGRSRAALSASEAALADSVAALAASRRAERVASELAMHDQKTGLPNRSLFDDRLAQAIAGAERHGWMLALMFLDLDRFKLVNDTHGHAAGDAVLTTVADRLMRHVRDEDTVCRNGGDEFLYLLINPAGRAAVARIADLIRQAIGAPISVGGQHFSVTPSIGIALYPEHAVDAPTLVAHADAAMYRAKHAGSHIAFFDPQDALALGPAS